MKTSREEERLAERKRIELTVAGMTCAHCVTAVRKGLAAVPGVSDVVVTLDPPRAVVTYDPAKAGPEQLMAAVREAGYEAAGPGAPGG